MLPWLLKYVSVTHGVIKAWVVDLVINIMLYAMGKKLGLPILVTERWALSSSRCTGSQPAGHPPGVRLSLPSARPTVTFPAAEHHCSLAGNKLYCLVTEAHRCEQLAQGCYAAFTPSRIWTHDASPTLYPLRYRSFRGLYPCDGYRPLNARYDLDCVQSAV